MKLYYAPEACSLSDHIALLETGRPFETESVNIHTKRTASGRDFLEINPKGYVPALALDDGQILTENVAVLDWIAEQHPALRPPGPLGRTRQVEMLTFISTEIHRSYKPLWHDAEDAEKQRARDVIARLLAFADGQRQGAYLFGDAMSAADCYLFVMLRWAERFGVRVPDQLLRLQWRMEARPSVQAAIAQEGLFLRAGGPSATSKVRENAAQHRFERSIHDNVVAAAYYRNEDGKVVFIHTEVPTEFSGLGIGTELARGALDLLRLSGRTAILVCPFMVRFANKHPEYADIVD